MGSNWLGILQVIGTLALSSVGAYLTLIIARGNQRTANEGQAFNNMATLSEQRGNEIERLQANIHDLQESATIKDTRVTLLETEARQKDTRITNLEQTNVSQQAQIWGLTQERELLRLQFRDALDRITKLEQTQQP